MISLATVAFVIGVVMVVGSKGRSLAGWAVIALSLVLGGGSRFL